ncbi:sugar ABC transporter substrate-binding protein [Geminicoccaceae bacterium 1502E]|nr:sugar ABC transporter substrate-binding protein [Geminicoccaceae bacterium 1502E]
MRHWTRIAAVAIAATALGAAAGPGTGAAQDTRIVVVSHGQASDPFWSVVKNGVDDASKTFGVNVEYRAPDTFDMVKMAQLIDAAVASAPSGLVVSIPDADALGDSIRNAVASGIPVISMNSGSDVYEELGVRAHVGQTEFEAGLGGGKKMAAAGVKKALCVNQEVGNVALDLRCEGFAKGLGGEVEVLAVKLTDPTATASAIKAHFGANPDTEGVLTLGPSAAEPTMQALDELDLLGKVKFATFDLSPSVLEAIRDGKMEFAIDQQQFLQGYLPVAMLALNDAYGTLPAGVVQTGPGFVTKDNAAQVIDLSKKGIR